MTEVVVGSVDQFGDPARKVLEIDGIEVAVFRHRGKFTAFENVCPHMAGPACQGRLLPLTLEDVREDRTSGGRVFSKERMNVTCPWHGMEFDIETGQHPANRRLRLIPVAVRVEDGAVYVTLPRRARDHVSLVNPKGQGESSPIV